MSTAFRILMGGGQEVPPNGSTAQALGTVVFDDVAVTATYEITVKGLDFGTVLGGPAQTFNPNDDVTGLHVHNAAIGVNGPVVFGQRAPAQDTDDFAFSFNPNNTLTFSGIWETTDPAGTSINSFAAGLGAATVGSFAPLYWNIHTSAFPGGEIRGQWECIATDASDVVGGTKGADILPGLDGDDVVKGDNGADRITGGDGDDALSGGTGDDVVDGGNGKDRIRGDRDGDELTGGAGKDKFFYRHANESLPVNPDQILDFDLGQGDNVDLKRVDANPFTGPDDAFVIVTSFSNTPGEALFTYLVGPDETRVELDITGDGVSDITFFVNGAVDGSVGFQL